MSTIKHLFLALADYYAEMAGLGTMWADTQNMAGNEGAGARTGERFVLP